MDTDPYLSSSPHAELLTRFQRPQPRTKFDARVEWEGSLREPPSAAVARFIAHRLIEPAPAAEKLAALLRVADLRIALKARGLPTAGRESVLVDRILDADPDWVRGIVEQHDLWWCSEPGRALVERYRAWRAGVFGTAVREAHAAFLRGDCDAALRVNADYEQTLALRDPWARTGDRAFCVRVVTARPEILAGMDARCLARARAAAATAHLLGADAFGALTPGYADGSRFSDKAVADMIIAFARHQEDRVQLAGYLQATGDKFLRIWACEDARSCAQCQARTGRRVTLAEVPEIPFSDCTSVDGCRCSLNIDLPEDA